MVQVLAANLATAGSVSSAFVQIPAGRLNFIVS
jgi:hypothetical protein